MSYTNPVIPGFYPDPSVCRVGEDYYLVTSTFEYFPGVPVFHSKDLVNWEQIGHCLTRKSQLPLEHARASQGIYAPTIRYRDGRFYMVTTNVSEWQNFYVWTEDPAGEWSEPIFVDMKGIDPSFLFDDDGKVYFQCAGNGNSMAEIDIETGKLLSEEKPMWSGTGGKHPEGPHLYKINGMYYLMIAEGGTEYGHMETIARSENPWGPFEECPHNPLLRHRDLSKSPIQATGHADLVEAHDGSWWMVHLGFRPQASGKWWHHLGRETFLAPVTWDEEGWPVVNGGGEVFIDMECDTLPPVPVEPDPAKDDFNSEKLNLCWNFLRNPNEKDWSLAERPGFLRLNGSAVSLSDQDSPAWVGRRQQHFDFSAETVLEFTPASENEEAGICVLMNDEHHYDLAITLRNGKRCAVLKKQVGDIHEETACLQIDEGCVRLKITGDVGVYTFSVIPEDGEETILGTGRTRYLSKEVADGFTGVYIGLYASGNGTSCFGPADFGWFEYKNTEDRKQKSE